jgi:hypothetical protein
MTILIPILLLALAGGILRWNYIIYQDIKKDKYNG